MSGAQLPPSAPTISIQCDWGAEEVANDAFASHTVVMHGGKAIPNSVMSVAGILQTATEVTIDSTNNKFTMRFMPVIMDTPVTTYPKILPKNNNLPAYNSSVDQSWPIQFPNVNTTQQDVYQGLTALHYNPASLWIGQNENVESEQNSNVSIMISSFPSVEGETSLSMGAPAKTPIQNPYGGQAVPMRNMNNFNGVTTVQNRNTFNYTFGALTSSVSPGAGLLNMANNMAAAGPSGYSSAVDPSQYIVDNRPVIPKGAIPVSNFGYGWCQPESLDKADRLEFIYHTGGGQPVVPTLLPLPARYDPYTMSGSNKIANGATDDYSFYTGNSAYGYPVGYPGSGQDSIFNTTVDLVYGQNFFNTYQYSLLGRLKGASSKFCSPGNQPFPGMYPYDFMGHSGNHVLDLQHTNFTHSLMMLIDADACSADNVANGYHIVPLNNSEDSCLHLHLTNPGATYQIKIGHSFIPVINKGGANLFHAGWPIPCKQIIHNAVQPQSLESRTQHSFNTFFGFSSDLLTKDSDYQQSLNILNLNRAVLATGANLLGAYEYPKNHSVKEGIKPAFFNFPPTIWPINMDNQPQQVYDPATYGPCIVQEAVWMTIQDTNLRVLANLDYCGLSLVPPAYTTAYSYWASPEAPNSMVYSNNWLCPFPQGVCSDTACNYTGRPCVIMQEVPTKNMDGTYSHSGNYTEPMIWETTITIPNGSYTIQRLLDVMNLLISQPDSKGDYPLYRTIDFETPTVDPVTNLSPCYMLCATDYENDTNVWNFKDSGCTTPANRYGPSSSGHTGRIVNVKRGAGRLQIGANQWVFGQNGSGNLYFGNSFSVAVPFTLLATSSLQNVPSLSVLTANTCSRSTQDYPLYGNLGQTTDNGTVVALDAQAFAQCFPLNSCVYAESSIGNAALNLLLATPPGTSLVADYNSAGIVTNIQTQESLTIYENALSSWSNEWLWSANNLDVYPANIKRYVNPLASMNQPNLYTHAKQRVTNGVYFNPCSSTFIPGTCGIFPISFCDGSAVQKAFWTTLGFNADALTNYWSPVQQVVAPREGVYYNPNTSTFNFDKDAFVISNQSPSLHYAMSHYYASSYQFAAGATVADQVTALNTQILPGLPKYSFELTVYNDKDNYDPSYDPGGNAGAHELFRVGAYPLTTISYLTNCPLFTTAPAGLPLSFTMTNAEIIAAYGPYGGGGYQPEWLVRNPGYTSQTTFVGNETFELAAYVDEGGLLQVAMKGLQHVISMPPWFRSVAPTPVTYTDTNLGQYQPLDGSTYPAWISVLSQFSVNPYVQHMSIPHPLHTGSFLDCYRYKSTVRDGSNNIVSNFPCSTMQTEVTIAQGYGANNDWEDLNPCPWMFDSLNFIDPTTQIESFGKTARSGYSFDFIPGSMISFPPPTCNLYTFPVNDTNNILNQGNQLPLITPITRLPYLQANPQLGAFWSLNAFMQFVDQSGSMLPSYTTASDFTATISGYQPWFIEANMQLTGNGPLFPTGDFTDVTAYAAAGNWYDVIAWALQNDPVNETYGDFTKFEYGYPNNSNAVPTFASLMNKGGAGWQFPLAGRVQLTPIPYYANSAQLAYDRNCAALQSVPEMQGASNSFVFKTDLDRVPIYDDTGLVNRGAAVNKVGFVTNFNITNEFFLGQRLTSNITTTAGVNFLSPLAPKQTSFYGPPLFTSSTDNNADPSDPYQQTQLFSNSFTAPGQLLYASLLKDNMFYLRINGTPDINIGSEVIVNGETIRNVVILEVNTANAVNQTLTLNDVNTYAVPAQTISSLSFEFLSRTLQPLTGVVAASIRLTLQPTGAPLPNEAAFDSGVSAGLVEALQPASFNYAGNITLPQPPASLNIAQLKQQTPGSLMTGINTQPIRGITSSMYPTANNAVNPNT